MAFDECPPGQSDYQYAKKSLMMTQRWLDRCFKRFNETAPLYGHSQSLFPIVQGCTFKDLRQEAAKFIADKGLKKVLTIVDTLNTPSIQAHKGWKKEQTFYWFKFRGKEYSTLKHYSKL